MQANLTVGQVHVPVVKQVNVLIIEQAVASAVESFSSNGGYSIGCSVLRK